MIMRFHLDRMKKPRSIFNLLLTIALLCFGQIAIFAERLPVRVFTTADGVGSSFVDGVFRDSHGFMWFCTRDGLSRFDGLRFITYQIGDKNSSPGVEDFFEASNGDYWISTTGGIYRFRPNTPKAAGQEEVSDSRPNLSVEF